MEALLRQSLTPGSHLFSLDPAAGSTISKRYHAETVTAGKTAYSPRLRFDTTKQSPFKQLFIVSWSF